MIDKPNILKVSGLKVEFNGHIVLDNISFEVKRDDTLAIIGPNGAGKTVLFRSLLGLTDFQGKVEWAPDAKIGYVPQKLSVAKDIPITAEEFLGFKEKNHARIHEVLADIGFQKSAEHSHNDHRVMHTRLGELSGGELQRILITYALLDNPNVLLMDEPTAGVDIAGEETIYGLIHRLQAKEDLTIIFISHELQVVNQYANNVLCLNKEKICYGPPLTAIDKESLTKMYGEEVHLYRHHEEAGKEMKHHHGE